MHIVDGAVLGVRVSKPMGSSSSWNVVLMAVHDETMAFISLLWLCVMQERFGRENAEESPLLECLFKHRNEIIQMKTDKKMAYVKKYLSLI
jgi:hypothetical protein